jgi:hypothetical protein
VKEKIIQKNNKNCKSEKSGRKKLKLDSRKNSAEQRIKVNETVESE